MTANEIDWPNVRRVLVVKLRSIGDTVLSTPSLIALRRFLPDAQIDILLEDWVAPVLDGFDAVDNVISVGKGSSERLKTAWKLRGQKYDVAINLHGGTTATMFVRASGAPHRIGYSYYQYPFLYNYLLSSAADFWKREKTHSAEQQLALIGFVGVPVDSLPKTRLAANERSIETIRERHPKFETSDLKFTLLHPSTAFFTKQWPTENFARTAEFLAERGFQAVAVGSKSESKVLDDLKSLSMVPVTTFDDLTLPEITVLASKAKVFVGNDSGIAHIAAAVGTPSVVVFGSSNRDHWRPWTDAPNEIVFEPFACQPCPGYECKEFGDSRCIRDIPPSAVFTALERVLSASRG
ncbi:MAG: glycosyltransferase family 9 protein [Acidobacteria bacterium]|nr:glycosyltransferase family 9 protein [Acidobacteriota bacterium]